MIQVETDVSEEWDSRIDWPALAERSVRAAVAHSRHAKLSESEAEVLASSYEIEIAGERFAAEASLKPMYDPKAERVRV